MRKVTIRASVTLAIAGVFQAHGQVSVEPLYRVGMPAPGFPAGAVLSTISQQVSRDLINSAGQTYFNGMVTGGGVVGTNDTGLWRVGTGNDVHLVWREGGAVDSLPGLTFGPIYGISGISSDGSVIAIVQLLGANVTGLNDYGIFRIEPNGTIALIAREGDAYAGGGVVPMPRSWVQFNDRHMAWYSTGIWTTTDTGIQRIAELGGAIPGVPGETFTNLLGVSCMSAETNLGFVGNWAGPQGAVSGIFQFSSDDGVELLVQTGQGVQDVPGATVSSLSTEFNGGIGKERGALRATIIGGGATAANDDLRYRLDDGALTLAVREGSPAPLPNATVFSISTACPTADYLYFVAVLAGPGINSTNNLAVMRSGANGLEIVLRRGDAAPGLPSGTTIGGNGAFANDYTLVANAGGQVAMNVQVIDNDGNSGNDSVLYLLSTQQAARPILRTGDSISTADGLTKTIQQFLSSSIAASGIMRVELQYTSGEIGIYRIRAGCASAGCEVADVDHNCVVDLQDLANLLANFGASGAELAGDTDSDDDVDLQDLANVLAAFGADCTG